MSIWGEIGKALNSTIKNPAKFEPLDSMLCGIVGEIIVLDTPGTYTVRIPRIVKYIYITACGGGGAGGNGASTVAKIQAGGDGEATVIGDLITLAGGLGGFKTQTESPGNGGGYGGQRSKSGGSGLLGAGGKSAGTTNGYGGGGGGSIGDGGDGSASVGADGTRGGGGAGGSATTSSYYGAAGGSGAMAISREMFEVENLEYLEIAVGAGGKVNTTLGDSYGYFGGKGGDGYVKIEWGLAAL